MRTQLLNAVRSILPPLFRSLAVAAMFPLLSATPPAVGDKAPDFALPSISGKTVRLSELTSNGPIVLIVLRGYPGYQCPFCNRQAQEFIQKSQDFVERGAQVVMIYPGPPENIGEKAKEFIANKTFPEGFELLLDSGYEFTNLYGLRWNAPKETAYPSTFLIDRQGVIFFSKIAKVHGGRATTAEILDALPKPKAAR